MQFHPKVSPCILLEDTLCEQSLVDVLQAGVAATNAVGRFEVALEYFKRFPWKEYEEVFSLRDCLFMFPFAEIIPDTCKQKPLR